VSLVSGEKTGDGVMVQAAVWGIVGASILLMLVRPRDVAEVWWVGGGVLLLVGLRLVSWRVAWRAAGKAVDVCLFLVGMMLLSELARECGVFDWLSGVALRSARGSAARLFLLVYGVGTAVTVFMPNDATAVVLTPAILAAVRKARVTPLPYLFVCAFIANAASFLLPISNPANLVVFHGDMPALGRWLVLFGGPCLVSIVVTYAALRWLFREELRRELPAAIADNVERANLSRGGILVLAGLAVVVAVLLAASAMGQDLGLPTFVTALTVTTVVAILERESPWKLAREISWATLALVAGLFVLVDAAVSVGAMSYTTRWLAWAERLPAVAGALVTGFGVGVANNVVNNLPLGLMAGSTLQAAHTNGLLASAVLIGVDLGPNLSITGSLATILWLLALRKEKLHVSFWSFLKIGLVAMPMALLAALGSAILLQVIFHGA
jgi:arsenical pump membrane protein